MYEVVMIMLVIPKNLDWVFEAGGLLMSGTYFMKMTNGLCEQCRVHDFLMAS